MKRLPVLPVAADVGSLLDVEDAIDDVRNLLHCAHEAAMQCDDDLCDGLQTCLNYARRRLEQAQAFVSVFRQR